jgi:hypothetical protein
MPEAAINVDCNAGWTEDDVGSASQARKGLAVYAVSEAARV